MNISLNWLKKYVAVTAAPAELEKVFPMMGLEVEAVRTLGLPELEGIVVGEVLEKSAHPNADRLSLCRVRVEADGEPLHIVCGASNFQVGDRVPVALVGATMPDGFKIKKSKLRGEVSEGMMCSACELGLGNDHEGLLILRQKPEIGTPLNTVFPDSDTLFELELTANRGDCLSHIGVARELAAYYGLPLQLPEVPDINRKGAGLIDEIVLDTPDCPYYTAWSVRGVKIGESPDWLKQALSAVGLRPINNVVDVTNFVLLESGQPLHAFDADKLEGGRIVVRQARDGETLQTLDDKTHRLDESMMVIADAERPHALAGVMGGAPSEVTADTTNLVLESAWFRPGAVRATARKLNLHTDSSHRFARDVDPAGVDCWARRAVALILEVAGGTVAERIMCAGKPPRGDRTISISPDYVRRVCGFDVEDDEIAKVFRDLGFDVKISGVETEVMRVDANLREVGRAKKLVDTTLQVTVPSFRPEVDRPIDLVEEFIRVFGTSRIPDAQVTATATEAVDSSIDRFNREALTYLSGRHLHECCHYSLTAASVLRRTESDEQQTGLALANPLTSEMSHLRASLLPGLLDALRVNRGHGNVVSGLCETGRVFRRHEGQTWELCAAAFILPVERGGKHWSKQQPPDFFTAKNLIRNLAARCGINTADVDYSAVDLPPLWQKGHAAFSPCWAEKGFQLRVGLISLDVLQSWDLDEWVLAGELLAQPKFLERPHPVVKVRSFSPYPPTTRDLALVVEEKMPAAAVQAALYSAAVTAAGDICGVESVELFDLYRGKGVAEGYKSLAFTLTFRSKEQTLTDAQINPLFNHIQDSLKQSGYQVRAQ